ncbi:Hypothetical predicted protein, partial [Drosophila guanche]
MIVSSQPNLAGSTPPTTTNTDIASTLPPPMPSSVSGAHTSEESVESAPSACNCLRQAGNGMGMGMGVGVGARQTPAMEAITATSTAAAAAAAAGSRDSLTRPASESELAV